MGASSIQYTATSLVPASIRQLSRTHTHTRRRHLLDDDA